MKKRTVGSVMVVCMLLAVSLYFVGGTYARYADDYSGTATVEVAHWSTTVTGAQEKELNVQFTTGDNDDVVSGKIAPGVTASADIEVNLSGTETSVEMVVETDKDSSFSQKIQELGINPSDVEVKVSAKPVATGLDEIQVTGTGDSGSPFVIKLKDNTAFSQSNGKFKVSIQIVWTNNEHNEADTIAGKKLDSTLELPITLKVQQHIGE